MINRGIYNMFETPIIPRGYPMAGAHIGTAFALYGLGKLVL